MPVTLGPITVELSCLVVQSILYKLIVGRTRKTLMHAPFDFDCYFDTFRHEDGVKRIALITECTLEDAS